MRKEVNILADKKLEDGCEQCCGSCCHFKYEDTDGWGLCQKLEEDLELTHGVTRCSDVCRCDGYVSDDMKRHQMAVLRQCQRCLRNNMGTEHDLDVESVCEAIDFVVDYVKSY